MKGLYICLQDFNNDVQAGVNNKIKDQVEAFNDLDIKMTLIGCSNNKIVEFDKCNTKELGEFKNRIQKREKIFNLSSLLIQEKNIDYIYIRYFKSDRRLIKFLSSIKSTSNKIIIEIPTYPYDTEERKKGINLKTILSYSDRIYRKKLKKYVDYIVTFSEDKQIFGIPAINIENGINIKRISVKKNNQKETEFVMLGVAALSFWHGYDRIIKGIRDYYDNGGTFKIKFNIVGEGDEKKNLERLAEELGVREYVNFKGVKVGQELNYEFDNANIAIGSLGIHRLGVQSVSTLKLREYCARGILFVYSYIDKSFLDENDFSIKLKNDDSDIKINDLIYFYNKNKNGNYVNDMVKYSERFSWKNQVCKMMEIIQGKR